jgi:hypothetical protein
MSKNGRTSGAPGKGNPGGERGGNRAGGDKQASTPSRKGQQSAGADPRRGQPG